MTDKEAVYALAWSLERVFVCALGKSKKEEKPKSGGRGFFGMWGW